MRSWRISTAQLLSLSFGVLITVGLGLVIYLGVSNARHNTQALLSSLTQVFMESVEQRIDNQLQPIEQQLDYLVPALSRVGFEDKSALILLLKGSMAATPQVMGLAFHEPNNTRTWVERGQDQAVISNHAQHRSAVLEPFLKHPPAYPFWQEPLWSPRLKQVVLPRIHPVWIEGQFIGLLVGVISIADLSQFVAELSEQLDAELFILRGEGQVLAARSLNSFMGSLSNPGQVLPDVKDFDSDAIRLFNDPRRQQARLDQQQGVEAYRLDTDQQDYFYLAKRLSGYGEQDWIIGASVVTEGVFNVIDRVKAILSMGLVALAVALLLVLLLSRRLAAAIEHTEAGFKAIGKQPLEDIAELEGSRIKELDRVHRAYNRMLVELRQSETSQRLFGQYVPQAIARELLDKQGALKPRHCEATVLFCDIEGFTGLTQQLGPERLVELLNGYFSLLTEIIEGHGGVITQFQGDAILATFNVPVNDPDHPLNACKAAQQIIERLAQSEFDGLRLNCRIGINTGELIAGSVGAKERRNYTVHGDTVNLAARLESMNKEFGTRVLISEYSAAYLPADQLRFVARTEARGREGEIRLYTLAEGGA